MRDYRITVAIFSIFAIFDFAVSLKERWKAKEDHPHPANSHHATYSSYTVHHQENWGDAWRHCKDNGGHLLVINSEGELKAIMELIQTYGLQDAVYIGVHDMFQEGRFFTVTGEDLMVSRFNIWQLNEPNNYMNREDCAVLTSEGVLNDVDCSNLQSYICEYEWSY